MITCIDEESKKEHIGPSAWKKASKSTIRRIRVERAAPMGQDEESNGQTALPRGRSRVVSELFV
jgi:hypothetical protein